MNETKWEELRLGMYGLAELAPRWRTKDIETGYVSPWDGEWFYHFREGGYDSIERLEVQVVSPTHDEAVREVLRRTLVPGKKTPTGYLVHGYVLEGTEVDYF